ncbi:MAG: elongation factor Ts [Bacteroidales bacterium]|nr:elongation factor Ts [Candidatus Colimorpha onthohippi]
MATITAKQVNDLRQLTGVGMMDCKKALVECDGDTEKAIELLRQKGQKMAAKRADRDANEGCVLAKSQAGYGAIIMVSCETDFVATNADFVAFANSIIDNAMAKHLTTKDAVLDMEIGGRKVADLITDQIAKIGEKIEVAHFEVVEAPAVYAYIHPGNRMASIIGLSKAGYDELGHGIAMHVVAMRPLFLDETSVSQETKDAEMRVNIEKTKAELIQKAVDAAVKKAGINPAHVDSEEHIASNIGKGWLTQEQADQFHEIKERVSAEKAASLNENQIMQIAQGRLNKYFQENALMLQEFVDSEDKSNVKASIAKVDKDLTCTGFKRLELGA